MGKFSLNFKTLQCVTFIFTVWGILKFFVIICDVFKWLIQEKARATHDQMMFWAVVGSRNFSNVFFSWQVNLPS